MLRINDSILMDSSIFRMSSAIESKDANETKYRFTPYHNATGIYQCYDNCRRNGELG